MSIINDRRIKEECGIVGVIACEEKPIAQEIYYGIFALQHRGQESAGIAVSYDGNKVAYYKNMGLVNEVFNEQTLQLLPDSKTGIGHVRYSTTGSSNVTNAQPIVFYGHYDRMAIAHNGNIANAGAIRRMLISKGHIFQTSIDSELIASMININLNGASPVEEGVYKACCQLRGAYSLVLIANKQLIAVRDKHGFRPLILGKKDGKYIVASESCALDAIDADIVRDIEPGEILVINDDLTMHSIFLPEAEKRLCIFEYVYIARSDSIIDGRGVYDARYECGKALAREIKIDADIVAGVPDSATVCAKGYSDFSGIPMVDALSRNRYIGRTFIQPSQSMREVSVKVKLNAFRTNIEGKKLILVDDSIVRGTTSRKVVDLLKRNGAKEVHMVVGSPPIKYPCFYGVDMQTREQFISYNRTNEEIRAEIRADSLYYTSIENLKKACCSKNQKNGFCTACLTGEYPEPVENEFGKLLFE